MGVAWIQCLRIPEVRKGTGFVNAEDLMDDEEDSFFCIADMELLDWAWGQRSEIWGSSWGAAPNQQSLTYVQQLFSWTFGV